MPTIEVQGEETAAGGPQARFCRVGSTWLDPAAVVAVAVEDDGFKLHLSGGQTVALPAAAAETAGVLKRLGIPRQKAAKRQKAKGRRQKTQAAGAGLLAAIASFLSS